MTSFSLRLLATACLALFLTTVHAAEPPIIAKARARLGTDAALDGITSIHYSGTLTRADPKDPTKQVTAKVDMIFQKPDLQRINAADEENMETTALDAYESWTRAQSVKDPTKWRLKLGDADQVNRLRANTWESLYYFRGIEKVGGRMEDMGSAVIDGVACHKIAFIHAPNIIFYRYFDPATGRLVFTETEAGSTLRESGELIVNGIRFPKSLVTTTKRGDKVETISLTYDKVMVNEIFPAAQFAMPPISNR